MSRTAAIGTTGGTISMAATGADGPVTVALAGEDLVAPLSQWLPDIEIRASTLARVGSPQLTIANALDVLAFARTAIDDGADGVVIVQGTDTLEEVAYLLDLVWDRPQPLAITGAMRASDDAGAEGMGNLVAAIRVVMDPRIAGMGVLAVLNDEAHAASLVRKVDANALAAFKSVSWGPVAKVVEGEVAVAYASANRAAPLPVPTAVAPRIPVLMAALDDDGAALRAVIPTSRRIQDPRPIGDE